MKVAVTVQFGELGYIAAPYWPEIEWLVKLSQAAGIHPKHGDDKKQQLMQAHCDHEGIPMAKVEAARAKIEKEKWYRDGNGNIMIPAHHFSSCLVQTMGSHPLKKVVDKDRFRSFVVAGDLAIQPTKQSKDGIYARYVKNPESNLRRYHEDEFVKDFEAVGQITFEADVVDADSLKSVVEFAGKWTGIGSARKMGYGKFTLEGFEVE